MGLIEAPKKLLYDFFSKLAIFLVRRRLKKGRGEPHVWLTLARLHEVRGEFNTSVEILQRSLEIFPNNPVLKQHLNRIERLKQGN